MTHSILLPLCNQSYAMVQTIVLSLSNGTKYFIIAVQSHYTVAHSILMSLLNVTQ